MHKKKEKSEISKKKKSKHGKFALFGHRGRRESRGDGSDDEFEEVQVADSRNSNSFSTRMIPKVEVEDIHGFTGQDQDSDQELRDTRKMLIKQNRKHKKSGGFQSMGLSHNVFKGVMRKGYKIPTPIQRKTIPLIMDGKDVVAMARTGSGKTAAFLIPMFERLKTHMAKQGARALILSPTRELALQTLKFTKELGKYTGLRSACILGGDRMEEQFESLHENPDIIIATPGRFMHVMVEMDLKLQSVEYVVFDEADRLFEMGFEEQLSEILQRLPESRQTLLFSATLPKLLVEFAKAGLHDPTLLRLDVDTKLSERLKLSFLQSRADDKLAVLLYLLRSVIKPSEQTVVFLATKHHVEYINAVLKEAGMDCTFTYSSLDQTARKINVAKFRNKKSMVMLVTDIAARGIDIPMLDNVINYNFPAKPKLFVHRVGRVARAGRSGTAYSLVCPEELAYVQDLHLFLGRPVTFASPKSKQDDDNLIGRVPQAVVDDEEGNLRLWHSKSIDLQNLSKVCVNAYKQYVKSRPAASSESVKRMKAMRDTPVAVHPLFDIQEDTLAEERVKLLESMRTYKPNTTIFEINSTNKKKGVDVMRVKRKHHDDVIRRNQLQTEEKLQKLQEDSGNVTEDMISVNADDIMIQDTFVKVVAPKQCSDHSYEPKKKKRKKEEVRDEENYVQYKPADYRSEMGLSMGSSFEHDAAGAVMDITGDEDSDMRRMKNQVKKWDRKKKKFVQVSDQAKKKVKTESGTWISKSYKTNIYKDWLEKNKVLEREDEESDEDTNRGKKPGRGFRKKGRFYQNKGDVKSKDSKGRREMKDKEQILKARRKRQKLQAFQKHRQGVNKKRRVIAQRNK